MRHGGKIRQHLSLRRAFREAGEQRPHQHARAFDDQRPAAQFRVTLEVVRVVEVHTGRLPEGGVSGNAGFAEGRFRCLFTFWEGTANAILTTPACGCQP